MDRSPTTRRRSTTAAAQYAAQFDLDDPSSLPDAATLLPWQFAAIREARRLFDAAFENYEEEAHVLEDVETGMPRGRILMAGGTVHTLYKHGGGFISYVVPSSCTVPCSVVGCCDPRRRISAGRTQ